MVYQQDQNFDVVVIGGGIYGLMLWMESTRRGLKSLLIEQNELVSGISDNSFRTLHGGLRHLQRADLRKFYEGTYERKWFLHHFPEQTEERRFLMPLQGRGINRRSIMALAAIANNVLTRLCVGTAGVAGAGVMTGDDNLVPLSKIAGQPLFYWHDGEVTDITKLASDLVGKLVPLGAEIIERQRVERIEAGNAGYLLLGESGPLARGNVILDTTAMWPSEHKTLGVSSRHFPSLAWNVHTDLPAIAADAIVLTAEDGTTLFLRNERGRLYLGTGHAGLDPGCDQTDAQQAASERIPDFLSLVNKTAGLDVTESNITKIEAGVLPVSRPGSVDFAARAAIRTDRTGRYYKVSGVKLTSARAVADKLLTKVARRHFGNTVMLDYDRLLRSTR